MHAERGMRRRQTDKKEIKINKRQKINIFKQKTNNRRKRRRQTRKIDLKTDRQKETDKYEKHETRQLKVKQGDR